MNFPSSQNPADSVSFSRVNNWRLSTEYLLDGTEQDFIQTKLTTKDSETGKNTTYLLEIPVNNLDLRLRVAQVCTDMHIRWSALLDAGGTPDIQHLLGISKNPSTTQAISSSTKQQIILLLGSPSEEMQVCYNQMTLLLEPTLGHIFNPKSIPLTKPKLKRVS